MKFKFFGVFLFAMMFGFAFTAQAQRDPGDRDPVSIDRPSDRIDKADKADKSDSSNKADKVDTTDKADRTPAFAAARTVGTLIGSTTVVVVVERVVNSAIDKISKPEPAPKAEPSPAPKPERDPSDRGPKKD